MRKVVGSAGVEQRRHSGSVQRPQAIPRPRRPCPDPVEEPLLLGWDPWDSPTVGTWTSLSTGEQTPTHESFVQAQFTLRWLPLWQPNLPSSTPSASPSLVFLSGDMWLLGSLSPLAVLRQQGHLLGKAKWGVHCGTVPLQFWKATRAKLS